MITNLKAEQPTLQKQTEAIITASQNYKDLSKIETRKQKRNIFAESLTVKEAEYHISTAMKLISELPQTTIISVLAKHGLLLRSERTPNSSFHEGYDRLRKKIDRTYDSSKKDELIREFCQLYIDHSRIPKSTFKYFETYFEMQNGLI